MSVSYNVYSFFCSSIFLFFFSVLSAAFPSRYKRRREFPLKDGSDWDADLKRELLYQDGSAHRHLDLRQ